MKAVRATTDTELGSIVHNFTTVTLHRWTKHANNAQAAPSGKRRGMERALLPGLLLGRAPLDQSKWPWQEQHSAHVMHFLSSPYNASNTTNKPHH